MTVVGGSVYNAEDKGKRKHLIAKAFCVKRFYLLKVFQHNSAGKFLVKNFYAQNVGKLVRSCGTCAKEPCIRARKIEVNNVLVDTLKECIVGLNVNAPVDQAVLTNIMINNAKKYKNGTFHAGVCKRYMQVVGKGPIYQGNGQNLGMCTWSDDVTIN